MGEAAAALERARLRLIVWLGSGSRAGSPELEAHGHNVKADSPASAVVVATTPRVRPSGIARRRSASDPITTPTGIPYASCSTGVRRRVALRSSATPRSPMDARNVTAAKVLDTTGSRYSLCSFVSTVS